VREAADPLEQHPEILTELKIPALAATGEHDMPDFQKAAEQLGDALPLAQYTVIPGVGHLAPLEAPEQFTQLLLGFLHDATTP
jgi:pimeloyl-ACP methyl ester carboxylesterase